MPDRKTRSSNETRTWTQRRWRILISARLFPAIATSIASVRSTVENGKGMADMTQSTTSNSARSADAGAITRFLRATEIDTRLLGMLGALLIIWIGFDFYTGGLFLTPRNLWNL